MASSPTKQDQQPPPPAYPAQNYPNQPPPPPDYPNQPPPPPDYPNQPPPPPDYPTQPPPAYPPAQDYYVMYQQYQPERYDRTPEERHGVLACLVWPLAITACIVTAMLPAIVPLIFAFLSDSPSRPPAVRKRYRVISILTSAVLITIAIAIFTATVISTTLLVNKVPNTINDEQDPILPTISNTTTSSTPQVAETTDSPPPSTAVTRLTVY